MSTMLSNITSSMKRATGRAGLKVQQKSPEILLGLGIVGMIGTVVVACRATLKADTIIENHNKKMSDINEAREIANEDNEIEYTDEAYRMDLATQYLRTAGNMARLYAPAIMIGTMSLAAILVSRSIMQKRYLGVVAAYNGVSAAFEEYRKRVREEEGELKDRHYRYGTDIGTIDEKVTGEDGKTKKVKKDFENIETDKTLPNDTSRFFDESNPNWDKNPQFSLMFLRSQQNYFNDLLQVRGHVFLNEVYDALGFDHTPIGAVCGWLKGVGDDFIDFGLFDPTKENVRRFVNGNENTILLEFNHDAVIYDKI